MAGFSFINTNYGATNGNSPPPYTSFYRQQNDPSQTDVNFSNGLPQKLLSISEKFVRIARTPWFLVLLTLVTTLGVCTTTMPITYCNDPLLNPGEQDRIRKEWRTEVFEHEKQVAEREAHWAWENEQHENLNRGWEQERLEHERELKERARREEEERKQLDLFWTHVETHQCKTYGAREYTAVLMNLPLFMNLPWYWERRMEACRATPLEIHGIKQMPTICEDKWGSVVGRWEINQNEPDCKPYWSWHKDKGCTSHGSGKRRIEHYLENLPQGGDYREFCATTPVRFHGMEFIGAHECFQYNMGTYGLWEIDDSDC